MSFIKSDGNGRTVIDSKPVTTVATGLIVGFLLMLIGVVFGMGVRSERIDNNCRSIERLNTQQSSLEQIVNDMAVRQGILIERIENLVDLYQQKQ